MPCKRGAPARKETMAISIDFSSAPDLGPCLSWLNSPAEATPTPAGLRVVPHVGDWWSRTADSTSDEKEKKRVDEAAPLLLVRPPAGDGPGGGDFDASCSVAMFHRRDYDQVRAGVVLREEREREKERKERIVRSRPPRSSRPSRKNKKNETRPGSACASPPPAGSRPTWRGCQTGPSCSPAA